MIVVILLGFRCYVCVGCLLCGVMLVLALFCWLGGLHGCLVGVALQRGLFG